MRETRDAQSSIFEFYAHHEFGHQLLKLSGELNRHPEILDAVAKDIGTCSTATQATLR